MGPPVRRQLRAELHTVRHQLRGQHGARGPGARPESSGHEGRGGVDGRRVRGARVRLLLRARGAHAQMRPEIRDPGSGGGEREIEKRDVIVHNTIIIIIIIVVNAKPYV